jgi:hypothetical protein
MAPTKANATYAATTLNLLTKVTEISLVYVAARSNEEASKTFRMEIVSATVMEDISTAANVVKET